MRTAYRVLGWMIAAAVVVQAAVIVFAVSGLFRYIDGGGVIDSSLSPDAIPEGVGVMIHSLLASYLFPVLELALIAVAAFTRRALAIWMAVLILALILLEWYLGVTGYRAPVAGLLHGANALVIFAVAMLAGLGVFTRYAPKRERGEHDAVLASGDRGTGSTAG